MNSIEFFISCHLYKEVLECVRYLHELKPNPIIHRDLKPHNILVTEKSRNGRFIKICDFGLATYDSHKTISHTPMQGTPHYMAPEVNRSRYTTKADVHSLGLIASEIFDFDINSLVLYISKKF